jgi:hypothetical protein
VRWLVAVINGGIGLPATDMTSRSRLTLPGLKLSFDTRPIFVGNDEVR